METNFAKQQSHTGEFSAKKNRADFFAGKKEYSFVLLKFLMVLTILSGRFSYAAYETYSVRKDAVQLVAGTEFFIVDGKFSLLSSGDFVDRDAHIELRLGVDENPNYVNLSSFTNFTVNVTVTPYNTSNEEQTPATGPLIVSYSTSGSAVVDMDYYELADYHKAKIKINSISGSVPPNVYLEAFMVVDRYYHIDNSFTPSVTANHVTFDIGTGAETVTIPVPSGIVPVVSSDLIGEVELAWNYIEGAEEYELQYTWVDNYDRDASDIDMSIRDFELNNTRIITKGQTYRIPIVYNEGFLLYRVRAIGRWTLPAGSEKLDKNYYGRWSTYGTTPSKVSDWTSKVEFTSSYERLKNWQYQAVFAELGKKKEIISFYDGSLRNRQTVTRINSNNEAIAGETIYDNQGRSAIQILPAPVANPALRYYENLNKNSSGTAAYNHSNFDWDAAVSPCTGVAQTMSASSGAAKYYSATNAVQNNWQDNVPNAEGYPFVQVEYTPDNTGRIRRQSGVGDEHEIGSGHETEYFYGQPYQEELNRLFGYEVGYKSRYKKNLVVDANGQVSVSYIDPQGRVIATALAGSNTTGGNGADPTLLSLASEGGANHTNQVIDMLNKDDVDDEDTPLDDNQLTSSGTFGTLNDGLALNTMINVADNGVLYEFDYRVRTQSFSDTCMPEGKAYPFAYTLDIDIQNDCGISVLDYQSAIEPIHENIVGTTSATYTGTTNADESFGFEATLSTGSYSLTKLIRINQDSLEVYLADYLATNTCIFTAEDFDLSQEIDCGDELDIDPVTVCSATEQMMLTDVSKGGQYGAYDGGIEMITSVYSDPNALNNGATLSTSDNWKYPVPNYKEADGSTSYVMYGGVPTLPKDLPYDVFIDEWKPSWAQSLLEYHPEYCYLAYYNELCTETFPVNSVEYTTESFDAVLMNIETYAEASSPMTNVFNTDLTTDISSVWNIEYIDPFFNQTTSDYTYISGISITGSANKELVLMNNLMDAALDNYHGYGMSMFDLAIKTVMCGTDLSGSCTTPSIGSLTTDQKDMVWLTFRSFYISEKKKINQFFVDLYTIKEGCNNGFIGDGEVENSFLNFEYYPTLFDDVMNLYDEVISGLPSPGSLPPYFFTPGTGSPAIYSFLYEDKVRRFVPISNLYNSGIPEDEAIEEMQAAADAALYYQTGQCPLLLDVQYFLDALAQGDYFDNSNIPSGSIPQFTADLYEAMGGIITTGCGTAVDIDNTINMSGNLEILSSGACGLGNLSDKIVLVPPGGGLTWSNYGSTWTIEGMSNMYYVPGSYSSPNYSFKILAQINQGGTITEVILDGTTTGIEIGECSYDEPCEREDNLGEELINLFTWLEGAGHLATLSSAIPLDGNVGWYDNSELQTQLFDFGSNAEYFSSSTGSFDIQTTDYEITVNFGGSYPANVSTVTGGSLSGSTLTIWYVDTSDAYLSATATVTLKDLVPSTSTIPFDLDCDCDAEANLEQLIQNLINSVLNEYYNNGMASPSGGPFYLPEVEAIEPYTDVAEADLYNFNYGGPQGATYLQFGLQKDTACRFVFGDGSNGQIGGIESVSDVQITYDAEGNITEITCIGVKSNGTTINLQTTNVNPGCLTFNPCDNCVPQPVEPVSCTTAFTTYTNAITILNDDIIETPDPDLDPEDAALFPVYDVEDFCNQNLAYITAAYLDYLTGFGITDLDDPKYLSIGEFANTWLPFGYDDGTNDLSSVVALYIASESELSWNDYVNTVYMAYLDEEDICPPNPMPIEMDTLITFPCEQLTQNADTANMAQQYDIYLENTIENFKQRYIEEAMASLVENLTMEYPDKEYHYTLYYYDQAGNLVQTVPPAGVGRIESGVIDEPEITSIRSTNPGSPSTGTDVLPAHTFETNYRYNSLNQLTVQNTPDGGTSYFAYDALGRLVVSQNALQLSKNQMSYTKYDDLGRIVEVGEMNVAASTYTFNANGKLVLVSGGALVDVSASNFPDNISSTQEEVVVTIYDEASATIQNYFLPNDYSDNNTRNRIVGVMYFSTVTGGTDMTTGYDNATFYDYDVHGNVKEVVQQNKNSDLVALTTTDQTIKKTEYEYELVSGNVKKVTYQKGKADQFAHKYSYDADNRITKVYTSANTRIWEQDAKYFYYDHGPLARIETGDKKVQATDFAYTVQGWIKGINSEDLDYVTDMGHDAQKTTANRMLAKDVYAYSLHYFADDYNGRFNNNFLKYSESVTPTVNAYNLYNGNIKEMYTAISDHDEDTLGTSHTSYRYDQLNRIRSMNQELITTVSGTITLNSGRYQNNYTYDANGNIQTMNRWMDVSNSKTKIDSLIYHYTYELGGLYPVNNQLNWVDDKVIGSAPATDLEAQWQDNYEYDAIGQLTRDESEDIDTIKWTVTGKVKEIIFDNSLNPAKSTTTSRIVFEYDAMGNRISKKVTPVSGTAVTTFYAYDAQGNPMSIYEHEHVGGGHKNLYLSQRNMYGSSRIGYEYIDQVVASTTGGNVNIVTRTQRYVGDKRFELSNHLGNVLDVVTDCKLPLSTAVSHTCYDGVNDYAAANTWTSPLTTEITIEMWVKTTSSSGTAVLGTYYNPGGNKGALMVLTNGKPGFEGKNGSATYYSSGSATASIADGTWHHVVGTFADTVNTWYIYVDGVLASSAAGVSGSFSGAAMPFYVGRSSTGSYFNGCIKEVSMWNYAKSAAEIITDYTTYAGYTGSETGIKGYWQFDEGSNTTSADLTTGGHTMNFGVGAPPSWTSDNYLSYYTADVVSYSDYDPGGMLLPGRSGNTSDYRYGYQGYLEDPEIKGEGNSYNTDFRQYDPRIGRWLSIDPRANKFPWQSPYAGMDNNPIRLTDPTGGETETDFYDAKTGNFLGHVNDGYYGTTRYVDANQYQKALGMAEQKGLDLINNPTEGREFVESYDRAAYLQGSIICEHDMPTVNTSNAIATNTNTTVGGGGTMPVTTTADNSTTTTGSNVPEISSDVSNGLSITGTVVGYAADGLPFPPGPVSTVGKVVGTGSSVLGIADNSISAYNDFNQGSYVRGTVNTVQAAAYTTGTILLFTPAAPIGGAILLYTTISDWLQSGIEYGTGVSEY